MGAIGGSNSPERPGFLSNQQQFPLSSREGKSASRRRGELGRSSESQNNGLREKIITYPDNFQQTLPDGTERYVRRSDDENFASLRDFSRDETGFLRSREVTCLIDPTRPSDPHTELTSFDTYLSLRDLEVSLPIFEESSHSKEIIAGLTHPNLYTPEHHYAKQNAILTYEAATGQLTSAQIVLGVAKDTSETFNLDYSQTDAEKMIAFVGYMQNLSAIERKTIIESNSSFLDDELTTLKCAREDESIQKITNDLTRGLCTKLLRTAYSVEGLQDDELANVLKQRQEALHVLEETKFFDGVTAQIITNVSASLHEEEVTNLYNWLANAPDPINEFGAYLSSVLDRQQHAEEQSYMGLEVISQMFPQDHFGNILIVQTAYSTLNALHLANPYRERDMIKINFASGQIVSYQRGTGIVSNETKDKVNDPSVWKGEAFEYAEAVPLTQSDKFIPLEAQGVGIEETDNHWKLIVYDTSRQNIQKREYGVDCLHAINVPQLVATVSDLTKFPTDVPVIIHAGIS